METKWFHVLFLMFLSKALTIGENTLILLCLTPTCSQVLQAWLVDLQVLLMMECL